MRIVWCVVILWMLGPVFNLNAAVIEQDAYKDINTYDITGTFDRNLGIEHNVTYGSFTVTLSEVYSQFTSQMIIPNTAKLLCSFNSHNLINGVLYKPVCNKIMFTLTHDNVSLEVKDVTMTSETGDEYLGPNIQQGYKVHIKVKEVLKVNVNNGKST